MSLKFKNDAAFQQWVKNNHIKIIENGPFKRGNNKNSAKRNNDYSDVLDHTRGVNNSIEWFVLWSVVGIAVISLLTYLYGLVMQ